MSAQGMTVPPTLLVEILQFSPPLLDDIINFANKAPPMPPMVSRSSYSAGELIVNREPTKTGSVHIGRRASHIPGTTGVSYRHRL